MHSPDKSICNLVLLALDVYDLKIKLAEVSHPYRLLEIQIRLVKQVSQSTMITHLRKPHAQKKIPPHLQGMNDSC